MAALTYHAMSADENTATVSVQGSVVTISAVSAGDTTIRVTAADPSDTDSNQSRAIQEIAVTVNSAPSLPTMTFTVPEDAAADTAVGSPLVPSNFPVGTQAWSITAGNTGTVFAIHPTTGQLTVIEPLDFETTGIYTLTVQLTVGAATAQATVTINVENVNEAPVVERPIPSQTVTVSLPSVTVDVAGYFSDPEEGALTYHAESAADDTATVRVQGSVVTISAVSAGDTTIRVTATDPFDTELSPSRATQQIAVTVNPAPSLPAMTFTVPEDAAADTNVGSPLVPSNFPAGAQAWSITAGNPGTVFAINPTTGQLTVIEPLDFETTEIYTLTVQLTVGPATATTTVTINVGPVNEAPTATGSIAPQTVTVSLSSATVDVAGHFSDPEDDSLTYHAMSADENTATVSVQGSIVTISAVSAGDTIIRVTAADSSDTDSNQSRATQEIAVTVNPAPSLPAMTFTVPEDTTVNTAVGSPLVPSNFLEGVQSWRITAGNTGTVFAINPTDGQLTVAAALDFETTEIYTLTVQLTVGPATATTTVTIDVGPVNEAPTAVGNVAPQTVTIGGVASVMVDVAGYFSDPERGALIYHVKSANEDIATVSVQGSVVTISAVAKGDTRIWVTATDPLDTNSNPSRTTQQVAVMVNVVPSITAIELTSQALNDVYAIGDTIEATVTFGEAVAVIGLPQLALTVGTETRQAVYAKGSSTATALVFSYPVAVGDRDADGMSVGSNALTLAGGRIRDAANTIDALITHSVTLPNAAKHKVDGVAPMVTDLVLTAGPYTTGDAITLTATFSEPVTVDTGSGTPQIPILVGSTSRPAIYVGGSDAMALVFTYTVIDHRQR